MKKVVSVSDLIGRLRSLSTTLESQGALLDTESIGPAVVELSGTLDTFDGVVQRSLRVNSSTFRGLLPDWNEAFATAGRKKVVVAQCKAALPAAAFKKVKGEDDRTYQRRLLVESLLVVDEQTVRGWLVAEVTSAKGRTRKIATGTDDQAINDKLKAFGQLTLDEFRSALKQLDSATVTSMAQAVGVRWGKRPSAKLIGELHERAVRFFRNTQIS